MGTGPCYSTDFSRPGSTEEPTAIGTTSEYFPDGSIIELIRDAESGELRLLLCTGQDRRSATKVQFGERSYRVPDLRSSIARVIPVPASTTAYGSTEDLFGAVLNTFTMFGISFEAARACTYFVFASWSHISTEAPILMMSGPPAAAMRVLELLGGLVRRGLALVELTSASLAAIADFRPTLVIDARHLAAYGRRVLSASPATYVLTRNAAVDLAVPKVLYVGLDRDPEFSLDFALHVHLAPLPKGNRLFTPSQRQQLIATMQPQLLEYRIRNLASVRGSDFDVPELTDENRLIARVLGASIVDAPDIQCGVRALVEDRETVVREIRFTDRTCIVVEVLFGHCHDPKRRELRVMELAEDVNATLKARGGNPKVEPRAVGEILEKLRVRREPRNSRGRRILFNTRVTRHIHTLARDYGVESIEQSMPVCTLCKEILGGKAEKTENTSQNLAVYVASDGDRRDRCDR